MPERVSCDSNFIGELKCYLVSRAMFFHKDPHLVGTKAHLFISGVGSKRLHLSPFVPVQSGMKQVTKVCMST